MLLSNILNDSFGLLSRQLRFYCWHFGRSLNQKHRQELIDLLYGHSFESLANKIRALDTNTINNCRQQVAKLLFEHCLSRNFRSQLIQIIESNLVDLNVRLNNYGHTLLHKSAYDLDVELVRILIQQGVNIRLRDYAGHTALHIAIQSYRNGSSNDVIDNLTEIIKLILEADKKFLHAKILKRRRDEAYNCLMLQQPHQSHTDDCVYSESEDDTPLRSIEKLSIKDNNNKQTYRSDQDCESNSDRFMVEAGQNSYHNRDRQHDHDATHRSDTNASNPNCLVKLKKPSQTSSNHYGQVMKTLRMDKQHNLLNSSLDSNHVGMNHFNQPLGKNHNNTLDNNSNNYENIVHRQPFHHGSTQNHHQQCSVDNIDLIFLDDYSTPLVNTTNAFGRTALHYCVQIVGQRHLASLLELLVSFGANADAIDRNLRTPLYFLIKSTNITDNQLKLEAIKYLLDNGCDDLGLAIRGHEQYFRNKLAIKVNNATTSINHNNIIQNNPNDVDIDINNNDNNDNYNNQQQQPEPASPEQAITTDHSSVDPIFTSTTFKRIPNLKHLVRLAIKRNEFNKRKKPPEQTKLTLPQWCPRSLEVYINKRILDQSEFI